MQCKDTPTANASTGAGEKAQSGRLTLSEEHRRDPYLRYTSQGYTREEIDAAMARYPAWWKGATWEPAGWLDSIRSIPLGRRTFEDFARHSEECPREQRTGECRVPMCGEAAAGYEEEERNPTADPTRAELMFGQAILTITPLIEKVFGKVA